MESQERILSKSKSNNLVREKACIHENLNLLDNYEINKNLYTKNEYLNILRRARNTFYTNALFAGDRLSDNDRLIISKLQNSLEQYKEQGKLIGILTKCQISGCKVHCIDKNGNILKHFSEYRGCSNLQIEIVENMNERLKKGYKLFKEYQEYRCVEVYEENICLVSPSGQVEIVKG